MLVARCRVLGTGDQVSGVGLKETNQIGTICRSLRNSVAPCFAGNFLLVQLQAGLELMICEAFTSSFFFDSRKIC